MSWAWWVIAGSLLAASGVGLGAFAAHALKNRLGADLMQVFEVAVRYQMYHALALLFVGVIAARVDRWTVHAAGFMLLIGTLVFSTSLYLYALAGQKQLVMLAPVGGSLMILGWLVLAVAVFSALV